MKTGLVLEGGAMRGLFTAGAIDLLMERGIAFDGMVGVSAGAAFGCNYKSRQPGRALRYNLKYCRDKRYCSISSLIKTGDIYGGSFCYHELPTRLDPFDTDAFAENPMDFYLVCTDVNTGAPVYHQCKRGDYEEMEWFRASASMPLVSRIVKIGTWELLDGGISDSVPVKFFEELGYDRIAVVLTRPKEYVKEKNGLMPLMKIALRGYPRLLSALASRHEKYNETMSYIRKKEEAGEMFVLRPQAPLPIGRLERDPRRLQQVYDTGRAVALEKIEGLKSFLTR